MASKVQAKKSLGVKQQEGVAEREHCLDLFRGLCLLGVIFNHTCFHSGSSYIPDSWAQWTMLLDVPALFFVSGMTYQTIKRDMIVNSLFKLSMVFTILSIILNAIYGRFSWDYIWKPLFLNSLDLPEHFLIVQQAYWFVPVYVAVLVIATIILKKMRELYGLVIVGCLGLYFYCFFEKIPFFNGVILGDSVQKVFFYLSLFLFGFFCKDKVIGRIFQKEVGCLLLVIALGLYYLTYVYRSDFVFNLFLNKFPPKLPYIALSFISISAFIFFYKAERKNLLIEHIGQNAIYYYAGQGIGAVLLISVVPYVALPFYFKLPLMFLLNLLITTSVAYVLKFIYNGFGRYYRILTKSTKA